MSAPRLAPSNVPVTADASAPVPPPVLLRVLLVLLCPLMPETARAPAPVSLPMLGVRLYVCVCVFTCAYGGLTVDGIKDVTKQWSWEYARRIVNGLELYATRKLQ